MTQINDGGNFKYNQIIRKSLRSAGLSELYLGQKYDYLVVSTRKCLHIVLKGTNYNWETQLSEGNMKKPGSKIYDGETYVKARVLRSMNETPLRVLVEFTPS